MAYVDAAFVQQAFDVAERKRETDVQHHRQADDLRAGFEVFERNRFGHCQKLCGRPAPLKQSSSDSALVPCVEQLVLQRLGSQHVSLDDIARFMGMSRRTLQRRIEGSGASFRSICADAKMRKATELLEETSATVSSIAFELDYSTASHFSRAFSKKFGVTPLVFRHSKSYFD